MLQKIKRVINTLSHTMFYDTKSIKYLPNWFTSILPSHNSITDKQPWMNFKVANFLKKALNKESIVFEYGSGGSTLFFTDKAKHVTSLDHHLGWYNNIKKILKKEKINNCDYILVEPDKKTKNSKYLSRNTDYKNNSFDTYVDFINKYPNNHFDLIVIDGRARASCFKQAINKVKKGGYILFDDSNRPEYIKTYKQYTSKFKIKHFKGLTPYSTSLQQTTIFKKK